LPITFSRTDAGDESVLSVAGSLDALTAPEIMPTIEELVADRRQVVVVNLAGLELIDSSGVAAIVALYKRVRAYGGKVTIQGVRDQPLAIFKLLRMDRVFSL
jgi:anti-sigma B factor antagonist